MTRSMASRVCYAVLGAVLIGALAALGCALGEPVGRRLSLGWAGLFPVFIAYPLLLGFARSQLQKRGDFFRSHPAWARLVCWVGEVSFGLVMGVFFGLLFGTMPTDLRLVGGPAAAGAMIGATAGAMRWGWGDRMAQRPSAKEIATVEKVGGALLLGVGALIYSLFGGAAVVFGLPGMSLDLTTGTLWAFGVIVTVALGALAGWRIELRGVFYVLFGTVAGVLTGGALGAVIAAVLPWQFASVFPLGLFAGGLLLGMAIGAIAGVLWALLVSARRQERISPWERRDQHLE